MRPSQRITLAGLALCGLVAAGVSAVEPLAPSAKEIKIRQFLDLSGAGNLGVQMMNQMLPSLKKMVPSAPESFWVEFLKEATAESLIDLIVPIYDRHLSESDLDQLIDFYSSPVGRKIIATTPTIMAESMAAGQAWGEQLAERVIHRAREAGLQPTS